MLKENEIHLEHIMPVTKGKWDVSDEIWKEYHARLGNLTLLYEKTNESLKNSTYEIKRESYLKSKIEETADLAQKYDVWDTESITKRQEELFELFVRRWPVIICGEEIIDP